MKQIYSLQIYLSFSKGRNISNCCDCTQAYNSEQLYEVPVALIMHLICSRLCSLNSFDNSVTSNVILKYYLQHLEIHLNELDICGSKLSGDLHNNNHSQTIIQSKAWEQNNSYSWCIITDKETASFAADLSLQRTLWLPIAPKWL